jgi:hypothetical protein
MPFPMCRWISNASLIVVAKDYGRRNGIEMSRHWQFFETTWNDLSCTVCRCSIKMSVQSDVHCVKHPWSGLWGTTECMWGPMTCQIWQFLIFSVGWLPLSTINNRAAVSEKRSNIQRVNVSYIPRCRHLFTHSTLASMGSVVGIRVKGIRFNTHSHTLKIYLFAALLYCRSRTL